VAQNNFFHRGSNPSLGSSVSHMNPIHTPPSNLLKTHFNNNLPPIVGCSKWSLSLKFPHQNPPRTSHLPHTCYMPCPPHSSCFDHPNNIWRRVQIIELLFMSSSTLSRYFFPLRPEFEGCPESNAKHFFNLNTFYFITQITLKTFTADTFTPYDSLPVL